MLWLAAGWWPGPGTAALAQQAPSPYHTRFVADAPLTAGLLGLSATGLYLVRHKRVASAAELAALDRANVPGIDRLSWRRILNDNWSAGRRRPPGP